MLPMHVILLIEGKEFPTYLVSNDHFLKFNPGELNNDQLIGEAAAGMYIHNPPDTPFAFGKVPAAAGRASDAKQSMWDAYQAANTIQLFGPDARNKKSGNAGFESRYYALLQADETLMQGPVTTFWETDAVAAWQKFEAKLGGRTGISSKELLTLLNQYSIDFEDALKQVNSAYSGFDKEVADMNKQLSQHPGLRTRGAKLAVGANAAKIVNAIWRFRSSDHSKAIKAFIAALQSQGDRNVPMTEVLQKLAPPFIGPDGKPLPLSDLKENP
jgi:hypothetical protein